jgi:hypothetical protein
MEMWQNGIRVGSNSGGALRGSSPSAFQWGQGSSDLCVYKYMIIYNRALTPWEIQLVSSNPRAFLMRKQTIAPVAASPIKNESVSHPMTIVSTPSTAGSIYNRSVPDQMTIDSVVGKDIGIPSNPKRLDPEIRPSFQQGYATGAHDAKYKSLRNGCRLAYFPKMGFSETLRDFSGRGNHVALNAGDASNMSTSPYGQRGLEIKNTTDDYSIGPLEDIIDDENVTVAFGLAKTDTTNENVTVAFGLAKTDTTNRGTAILGTTAGSTGFRVTHASSTGEFVLNFGGSSEGTNRISVANEGYGGNRAAGNFVATVGGTLATGSPHKEILWQPHAA